MIFLALLAAILIYVLYKRSSPRPDSSEQVKQVRDQEWRNYLMSFRTVVKTKTETALLEAMIRGETRDQYGQLPKPEDSEEGRLAALNTRLPESLSEEEPVTKVKSAIDNTLLLLYFGAFLLVASVGLFVALGGLSGFLRTAIVAITAATLYFGGLWLYNHSHKLAQAGISFVGSGMIITPLIGVSWYNLVSHKADGGIIWLLTSLVCIGLYSYSYKRIKNDFIVYLLIGSFVSSVESAVLTIGLPTYAYAWGLALIGIVLSVINHRQRLSPSLANSTAVSATLMVPLSVLGSAALLTHFGSLQLAVTLILTGTYYSLLSCWQPKNRLNYSLAAQVAYLAALANLVYAGYHSLVAIGVGLTIVAGVYVVAISVVRPSLVKALGLIEIASATVVLASLLVLTSAWPLVAALTTGAVLAAIIWQKYNSDEALQLAGLLLISLPFVVGQYALSSKLGSLTQLGLSLTSVVIIGGLVWDTITKTSYKPYYLSASGLYGAALAAALVPTFVYGTLAVTVVIGVVLASCVIFRRASKDQWWLTGSCLAIFVPLVYVVLQHGPGSHQFSLAVLAALVWTAGISLVTREAIIRWLVVLSILLSPVAVGAGGLGFHWGAVGFSLGYITAMLACVVARAIARGKLLVSFKVPIISYYTEASQAYVVGYLLAGVTAVVVSLSAAQSRILTTALLLVIGLTVIVVARIERQSKILALLPIVLQLVLFSGLRPNIHDAEQIGVTALVSVTVAVFSYLLPRYITRRPNPGRFLTEQVSLYLAYVGAGLVLTQSSPSRLLAVSLFIAGVLTAYHNWHAQQSYRELSVGVCLVAIHWLLYLFGVRNIQVQTHLFGLFLAGFAYWRYLRQDMVGSKNYTQALFLVVTVPLALQSIAGAAGGNYGLLLIAEQVAFMVAGAILPAHDMSRHFLLRWGLWTALAAILFQLRGLGYAFLSLLAAIIIGIAIYRLQKTPRD